MSFWRFGYQAQSTSTIDNIIDQNTEAEPKDVLLKLMAEDDLLQEAKSQNAKLVEFIAQKQVLAVMLAWMIEPPVIEQEVNYKYPYISCEVLCCENPYVLDELSVELEVLLDPMMLILDRDTPLNPVHVGYFGRVMSMLVMRLTNQFVRYLYSKPGIVSKMLTHMESYALVDLLLKLVMSQDYVQQEFDGTPVDVNEWLIQENFVPLLVSKLDGPESDTAAMFIIDLVQVISQSINPDITLLNSHPIMKQLLSQEVLQKIVGKGVDQCLVVTEFIRRAMPVKEPPEPQLPLLEGELANSNIPPPMPVIKREYLDITDMLPVLISQFPEYKVSLGVEQVKGQFGYDRLCLMQMIVELVRYSMGQDAQTFATASTLNANKEFETENMHPEVLAALSEHGMIVQIVDFLFAYQNHNVMHQSAVDMVDVLMSGSFQLSGKVLQSLFVDGQLQKKILDLHSLSQQSEARPQSLRLCNITYVTELSKLILSFAKTFRPSTDEQFVKNVVAPILQPSQQSLWFEYVNGWFKEQLLRDAKPLAGGKPIFIPAAGGAFKEVKQEEVSGLNFFDMKQDQVARFLVSQVVQDFPVDPFASLQSASKANDIFQTSAWPDYTPVPQNHEGFLNGDDSDEEERNSAVKEVWPDQPTPVMSPVKEQTSPLELFGSVEAPRVALQELQLTKQQEDVVMYDAPPSIE